MSIKLIQGDCLEKMKDIADGSVDMVLTDPPYGTIKGIELDGYKKIDTEWDCPVDQKSMMHHINRILRMNGCVSLFSQQPYTTTLISQSHGNLPFSYSLTWLKDHFASPLSAKKAPVNYTEDICVFFKKYDTLNGHPLRDYVKSIMQFTKRDLKEINSDLGHRRAEHFFYVDSTQFGLCTEETYDEIIEMYKVDKMEGFKKYEELKEIDRRFSRRFNLPEGKKYKSNVLEYKKDYTGHHPTQKPVALLEDLIKTYTNEGDTVLDFTMGSGSTGVACKKLKRNFIGIELESSYYEIAVNRINSV